MKFTGRGIFKLLFTGLFVFALSTAVFAQEEKTTVRVGLSNQSFSTFEHQSADFSSPDEVSITDMASNTQVKIPGAMFLGHI